MIDTDDVNDFGIPPNVLVDVVEAFEKLNHKGRENLLKVLMSLSNIELQGAPSSWRGQGNRNIISTDRTIDESLGIFSEDRSISPKDFILEKQPQTDVERVACLAYYLTHYREVPHFKTIDISALNTEAAQPKFANAAYAVKNAIKSGYLVPAVKGSQQISAPGEQFVQALPDREAAKATMIKARPKRKGRKVPQKKMGES